MTELQKLIECWRPIEEAPKDGTKIDLWVEELDARYPEGYYCTKSNVWAWDIEGTSQRLIFTATPPTHYMPLDTPEKLAKIAGALSVRLAQIASGDYKICGNTAEEIAADALQQAEKIAGDL